MLLRLNIFILLAINIFTNKIIFLTSILLLLVIFNIFYNNQIREHLKSVKILLIFYIGTFIVQLFYKQEGKVLFQIYNFYITELGLVNFLTNFLRILNLILISWIVSAKKMFNGKMGRYQTIIETVIQLVPEVFSLFKKKLRLKSFFRYILKQIRLKYES